VKLEISELVGSEIAPAIAGLAELRMRVFREWPYLYDGSLEYEARYLRTYLQCPQSLIVLVKDGDRVVGASSALPLNAETIEFQQPFLEQFDVTKFFYLAESVLLPEYRGRGLGVELFKRREAHAQRLGGFMHATFCAVERPNDHPLRPASYVPLDAFWQKRGYTRHPELQARYTWQDVNETLETTKTMTFWLKTLEGNREAGSRNSGSI
jgi:GNAT superfamily N-acetyltransferase